MLSGGRRFFCKKLDSLPTISFNSRPSVRHHNATRESDKLDKIKIFIPARIERGPTDILRALASTIEDDPTAYHYKYPDDPYFYPTSAINKKVLALSMESGRKAARWIVKENPGFFKHQLSEPPIEAFSVVKASDETEAELSEEKLLDAIEERKVFQAIKIYECLKSNNENVKNCTKQSLLELVCFYNSKDRPVLDLEEKWLERFLGKAGARIEKKKEWKKDGFANQLFEEMDEGCSLAHSALIQGMLKHDNVTEAMELYEAAKVKKINFSVDVYNAILEKHYVIVYMKKDIIAFVEKILQEMANSMVFPNLKTLNNALNALSRTNYSAFSKNLVKEFMNLGIEPSLGTFGYLFKVLSRTEKTYSSYEGCETLAFDLLDFIEGTEFEILESSDLSFFITSMAAFAEGFQNPNLALKLHKIFLKSTFQKFVVRGADEHGYYKLLFRLLFKALPIDEAMSYFRRCVCTKFNPESRVLKELASAIHESLVPEYLKEYWEYLKLLEYSKNRILLANFLQMMPDFQDESSLKTFHEVALSFLNVILYDKGFASGDECAFPFLLEAFVKNDDESSLSKVFEFLKEYNALLDFEQGLLESAFEYAVSKKNADLIYETLKLVFENGLPSAGEMAERALPLLAGTHGESVNLLLKQLKHLKRKAKPAKDTSGAEESVK